MPDHREVVIRLDWGSGTAEVWCAARTCEGRLRRLGFRETKRQIGGVWFTAPLKAITFRSIGSLQSRTGGRGNPAGLAKAHAARRRRVQEGGPHAA